VSNPGGNPAQCSEALRRCNPSGKGFGVPASGDEAGRRLVERVDDPVEFALARVAENRDRPSVVMGEGVLDTPHPP